MKPYAPLYWALTVLVVLVIIYGVVELVRVLERR